jgi:hypothetical protein
VLLELGRRFPNIGTTVDFHFADPAICDWLSISWSHKMAEIP